MIRRRVVRSGAAVSLAGFLLTVAAGVALGHAELDTANPPDKTAVAGVPAEVVLTFTEPLDPAKSSIKLADAGGSIVAQGSTVDTADPKTMRLPLPATLAAGTYTVRWISASALDGDLDHGTTTFKVVAASPNVTIVPTPEPTGSAIASPIVAPTAATPAPSSPPSVPVSSTSDAIIPIVVVLILLAGVGLWFRRGRGRGAA